MRRSLVCACLLMCAAAVPAASEAPPIAGALTIEVRKPGELRRALAASRLLAACRADSAAKPWLDFALTVATGTLKSHAGIDAAQFLDQHAGRVTLVAESAPHGLPGWAVLVEPPATGPALEHLLAGTIEPALLKRNSSFTIASKELAGTRVKRLSMPDGTVLLAWAAAGRGMVLGQPALVERCVRGELAPPATPPWRQCLQLPAPDAGVRVIADMQTLAPQQVTQGPLVIRAAAGTCRIEHGVFVDELLLVPGEGCVLTELLSAARPMPEPPDWAALLPKNTQAVVALRLKAGEPLKRLLQRLKAMAQTAGALAELAENGLPPDMLDAAAGGFVIAWPGPVVGLRMPDGTTHSDGKIVTHTRPNGEAAISSMHLGRYLWLASVQDSLYRIVDAKAKLSENEKYREAMKALPQEAKAIVWADVKPLAARLVSKGEARKLIEGVAGRLPGMTLGLWDDAGRIRGRGVSPAGSTTFGLAAWLWPRQSAIENEK